MHMLHECLISQILLWSETSHMEETFWNLINLWCFSVKPKGSLCMAGCGKRGDHGTEETELIRRVCTQTCLATKAYPVNKVLAFSQDSAQIQLSNYVLPTYIFLPLSQYRWFGVFLFVSSWSLSCSGYRRNLSHPELEDTEVSSD